MHFEILPPAQRQFWDQHAAAVPQDFVLYGGTAVALRRGHRQSLDFDFFSSRVLDEDVLRRAIPILGTAKLLQRDPGTFVVAAPIADGEVRLSFFGGISFGRVGYPRALPNRPAIASPLDLLATKLKVIHERVEAKDYLDIEVLLRAGLSLNQGISAARALFGDAVNPLITAKAVAWFKDGDLEAALPEATRRFLEQASVTLDPATALTPMALKSKDLSASDPT